MKYKGLKYIPSIYTGYATTGISYTVHGTDISLIESGTELGTKIRRYGRRQYNTTQDICQPLKDHALGIQNF